MVLPACDARRYVRGRWGNQPGAAAVRTIAGVATLLLGAACYADSKQRAPVLPSFDVRVAVQPMPVTSMGTRQLVYELHFANFWHVPLALRRVEVLDARDSRVLAAFHEGDLECRFERPGSLAAGADPLEVGPAMLGMLYLEIPLQGGVQPQILEHRIASVVAASRMYGEEPELSVVQGFASQVRTDLPVSLGPPLRGGPWVAFYHPSLNRGHRRVVYAVDGHARIPGRFAVDWVKLDAQGQRAAGDDDSIVNWHGYGADVLAVADGLVVATRNDVTESATRSGQPELPLADGTGNFVTLELARGRFAAYEHLKPGSIRVERGQKVKRGQVIAAVGYTGHSMGPHLHFHLADANSPLGAEGLPFVVEDFELIGSYPGFESAGRQPWTPLGPAVKPRRTDEIPAPFAVVGFHDQP
jgi:murein DD-endopeptidase